MNNKGFTIVEVLSAVLSLALFSGVVYIGYLVIMALRHYIGS